MIDASASVDRILAAFDNVRSTGDGKWSARCPAHDDRQNSLSISQGDDGKILVHCHANCATEDVLSGVGLSMSDLFPSSNGRASRNGKSKGAIAQTYPYQDEAGTMLYEAVRFNPKGFAQRRPKEGGGWAWTMKGVRLVPFRLPELLTSDAATTVWIPEGEKDVLALVKLGCVATTNVMGAGKWRPEYSPHLRNHRCVILPDNDKSGRDHAEQVAESLRKAGAASVKVLALPGLGDKEDVSNWLAAGGTLEQLTQLAADCPEWQPSEPARKPKTAHSIQDGEPNLTDVGNGQRFAIQHRDKFRFCHEQDQWYWWNLNRWRPDTRGRAMRAAKDTVRQMYVDAAKLTDHTNRLAMIEHAKESENVGRIKAMLTLAPSEDPFPVSPDEFDADPWLFNTLTGTIDLRTGKVSEPRREDLITKLAPVKWEPAATAENWLAFINLIFRGNANLITFTKRLLGYCLTGSTREQILPIFHGKGANGKSTLVGAIEYLMGDYAMTAPDGMLTVHRHEPHPTQLADLHGKRFVVATETEDGNAFAESLVKRLTGGDPVRARRMRENFWEFIPCHKIILQTNHRPKITGTDHAIWRRIRLVPFDYTIPENLRDKDFPKKLQTEAPGILRWLVDGALEWQREGLTTPPEVQAATEEYRLAEDVLGGFLATCCTCRSFDKAGSTALFEAFKEYSGDRETSAVKFAAMMEQRGFVKYRITAGAHRGTMQWHGVGLLAGDCGTDADDSEPAAAESGS